MIALCSAALAGSLAGTSIPSVGGGLAGPTEPGALGLITQPAASARGEAPELTIDVAAVATGFDQWVEGWEEPLSNRGVSAQPTLMLSVPVGDFGFGAAVHGSYLRSTDYEADGPQRLFIIQSNLSLIELDLSGSYEVTPWLTLGGGLRSGLMTYENLKGTDLGATLNRSVTLDPPLPVGDPLLQGTQHIGPLKALTASYFVGASFLIEGVQLDLSFRPQWKVPMSGPVQLQLSNAFNATVDGQIDLALNLPAHVVVASRIPIGSSWTVIPELEWVGWGRASKNTASLSNLSLTSSDPALDSLLSSSGLSEADFIKSQEGPIAADLRWKDVVNTSLQVVFAPREDVELRAGAGYSPSAIPMDLTTPSNVDFGGFTFKLAGAWRAHPAVRIGLTGETYQLPTRRVVGSPYTLDSPPDGQALLPSGNGSYAFTLWRGGLTFQLFIPKKRGV